LLKRLASPLEKGGSLVENPLFLRGDLLYYFFHYSFMLLLTLPNTSMISDRPDSSHSRDYRCGAVEGISPSLPLLIWSCFLLRYRKRHASSLQTIHHPPFTIHQLIFYPLSFFHPLIIRVFDLFYFTYQIRFFYYIFRAIPACQDQFHFNRFRIQ